jgi:hypothetical protein
MDRFRTLYSGGPLQQSKTNTWLGSTGDARCLTNMPPGENAMNFPGIALSTVVFVLCAAAFLA